VLGDAIQNGLSVDNDISPDLIVVEPECPFAVNDTNPDENVATRSGRLGSGVAAVASSLARAVAGATATSTTNNHPLRM
jgi:hypothetical protein